jgi:hypothetical protein
MIGKPQADEAIEAAEKIEKVISKRMNLDE